jgi:HEAT repeat protein
MRTLGLLGDTRSVHALETAIWYEKTTQVRKIGFEALAQLGTPEAVDTLLSLLEKPGLQALMGRRGILDGIAATWSPEAVPEMLSAVARTEDPELRAALIRGLAGSRDNRALDVLLEVAQGPAEDEARLDAINGLGLIGDPRALPLLEELHANGDESARRFSRTAIQRIRGAGT